MSQSQVRRLRTIGTVLTVAAVVFIGAVGGPITFIASAHDGGLTVTIAETNSPIVEGERLEVTVNVSNPSDDRHAEDITLTVGGVERDSERVELDGGENTTVTLTWVTESGDEGDYQATVAGATDSDSTGVTVEDSGPWYTVEIADTNAPIVEGETLRVNATVQNIQERTGNQTLELTVGGEVRDTKNVSLEGGEETTVTFTWTTQAGDAGNYSAAVSSNQEAARFSVQVKEPANFSVSIAETNSPVVEGDRLTVTAVVNNSGGVAGSTAVSLQVGGNLTSTVVTVPAGGSKHVTLSWATQPGDAGTYVANLTVGDTTRRTAVAVLAPQNFTVTSLETNSPVEAGAPVTVTAVIQNVGDLSGNQTVTFAVDGEVRNTTRVSLGEGANTTLTFTWQTATGDAGSYNLTVATANDTAERDVQVTTPPPETTESNEPPTASIQYLVDGSTPATVTADTTVEFVANASDADGTVARYEWRIDGEVVSTEATFEYTFDEPGTYQVRLRVTDEDGARVAVFETVEVVAPEPTATRTTQQTTQTPTQTTAYGPGPGVLTALLAALILLIIVRLRSST